MASPPRPNAFVRPLRRQYSAEFKQQLVDLSLRPGASVARIALDHQINANLVFKWRRESQQRQALASASLPLLVPVEIVPTAEQPTDLAAAEPVMPVPPGQIDIELRGVHIRITGAVDPASLHVVLSRFGGR